MEPRYYQDESHNAAWAHLREKAGSPLIVLPTGAGKSLVIAMLSLQALKFNARVMVLQHRKELIEQNAEKIRILAPELNVGVYSAGLKSRDTDQDVIVAGIQSVFRKADQFGRRELLIVDEAHLMSGKDDSMYGTFHSNIQHINPKARLIGLTATAFRTGEGSLAGPDKLFESICYEAKTGKLIEEGYLSEITNKVADAEIDTSDIRVRGGEFVNTEVERAFGSSDKVMAACLEVIDKCQDRESILIFASGVVHAENIAQCLRELTGETVGVVTGETIPIERSAYLSSFRDRGLRWLVNCDVLTTGFDAPCIDAIAVLRATMSPGLFAQIVGRGLRMFEGKENCLILDFGENIKRHGSLDDSEYGKKSASKGKGGEGVMKVCPNCENEIAAGYQICPECQFAFPPRELARHGVESDDESVLTGQSKPEAWDVVSATWNLHTKKNAPDAPPTLRVVYECVPEGVKLAGNLMAERMSEWVCFEHDGYAWKKAVAWWQMRTDAPMPESIREAIDFLDAGACRTPTHITTRKEGRWQRIEAVEFEDEKPPEFVWSHLRDREVDDDAEYSFHADGAIDDDDLPF